MSLALLFHYLMLNMFRMLIHPSSGACNLFVDLFCGLYCSGTLHVGVTLWFGWGDVVSRISRQSAHEGGNVVSPMHQLPSPPRRYPWYSFLLEAESMGHSVARKIKSMKNSIEAATFRLVVQCLNKLPHYLPHMEV